MIPDIDEDDFDVFNIVVMYLSLIRPEIGEYELVENYCDYSPGVQYAIRKFFEIGQEHGRSYRLHVVSDGLAFVENTTPIKWRHRLLRYLNESGRSMSR